MTDLIFIGDHEECQFAKSIITTYERPRRASRAVTRLRGGMTAIKDLIHLQRGRGFITTRDTDGKNTSRHPDGRTVQFWAENARGDIVS